MAKEMTVSWSSLETWLKCRQKDYLRTSGHKLRGADMRTFFPGTVADMRMRNWLNDPIEGELGNEELIEEVLDSEEVKAVLNNDGVVKWKGPKDRAQVKAKIVKGLTLLEPLLTEYVIPYHYIPEFRFRHKITIPNLDGEEVPVTLIGGMDILVTNEERTWFDVYDLKFTENKSYAATKQGQLTFYDLTTMLMLGQTCRKVAIFQPLIEDKPIHRFDIEDEDRDFLLHNIVEMVYARWTGDVDPPKGFGPCYQCDVAHACIKFITAKGRTA